jgi:hypothetical protein
MRFLLVCLLFGFFLWFSIGCEKDTTVLQSTPTIKSAFNDTIIWHSSQSPIAISDAFIVQDSVLLVIEPGVTVLFDYFIPLIVKGAILSIGTPSDSILLTCYQTGYEIRYWGGIHFLQSSNICKLEYTAVEYCTERVLLIEDSSPFISHCRLEHSFTSCETGGQLILCRGISDPVIVNCRIYGFSNFRASGILCFPPANPYILSNNIIGWYHMQDTCVKGGGFLDNNYLAAYVRRGSEFVLVPDTSLGNPADQEGDGIFTTNSTDSLGLFSKVDGVTRPRSMPN